MKRYNVVCAVVDNEGKVLCMQKGQTRFAYTSFRWEFPGGKIEEGETPQQALHRELLEEMDYDVEVGPHIITIDYAYPDFSITMQAFLCKASSRIFKRKEHAASQWVSPEKLSLIEWCAADKPIAEVVKKMMEEGKSNCW